MPKPIIDYISRLCRRLRRLRLKAMFKQQTIIMYTGVNKYYESQVQPQQF